MLSATFDESTGSYNFDNLTIYSDPDLSADLNLQIFIQCDSIRKPVYNQSSPYNIIDY